MKLLSVLVLLLIAAAAADAQTRRYPVTAGQFDGAKFVARYKLNPLGDFWAVQENGQTFIVIRDGVVIPDDPPIFDPPDSPQVVQRNIEKTRIDKERVLRAIVLLVLDEFNNHALKINAILDAVDQATSLADLKTRVAAIPDYPQRTTAQLITAIKNAIDSGSAD